MVKKILLLAVLALALPMQPLRTAASTSETTGEHSPEDRAASR